MLGAKLMKKAGFDTGFETRTLELLKLRFVESELHHCDVMLKDMQARCPSIVLLVSSSCSGRTGANALLRHHAPGQASARVWVVSSWWRTAALAKLSWL